MKISHFGLGLWLSALPLAAVTPGDTYEQLLNEKGKPASTLARGAVSVLTYADAVIRVEAGKVTSVKPAGTDYVVHAVDTPAPVVAAPSVAPSMAPQSAATTPGDGPWKTNYQAALREADRTGRKVLLLFTRSDSDKWCQRLERETLSEPEFLDYARSNFVMVKLDFPKFASQPEELTAQNQQLAQQYAVRGVPTVIVLDSAGHRIGKTGYMAGGPAAFNAQLSKF
jgi:protein disulfide-isomerase